MTPCKHLYSIIETYSFTTTIVTLQQKQLVQYCYKVSWPVTAKFVLTEIADDALRSVPPNTQMTLFVHITIRTLPNTIQITAKLFYCSHSHTANCCK